MVVLVSFSCGSVSSAPSDAGPADGASSADAAGSADAAADAQFDLCNEGMAHIPAGSFVLDNATNVNVAEFCIDTHPVSMAEYNLCDTTQGCTSADSGSATAPATYCNKDHNSRASDPANCVDAVQAETYCLEQGKALPDEGQWEWAARGGQAAMLYPWGNTVPLGSDVPERLCWQAGRGDGATWPLRLSGTCPIGNFNQSVPHPFGLEDMSGNIWHWTTTTDSDGRTVRGGGWDNILADRVTTKFRNVGIPASTRHSAVGFRCVTSVNVP